MNAWAEVWDRKRTAATLMLAGTRSDVYRLNLLAREALKPEKRLRSETTMETDRGPRAFAIGERMMFTRNSRPLRVKNGQTGTLVAWSINGEGHVEYTIIVDGGKRVVIDTARYPHLEYGYAVSVHKAQGQSVEYAFVLMSDAMVDREWSYVAASRHRKTLLVFVVEEQVEIIERQMARSRQKEVAMAYEAEVVRGGEVCLEIERE